MSVGGYGSAGDECCPAHVCTPVKTNTTADVTACPPLIKPDCGKFQEAKTINDAAGCPKLICGKIKLLLAYSSKYRVSIAAKGKSKP